MGRQGAGRRKTIQASNGLTTFMLRKVSEIRTSKRSICTHLWSISKQHIRQIILPQPPPSHSDSFTVEISSSRGRRRRREGDAAVGLPKGGGGSNRWGDGSRVPVPRERGKGPVHVRTQMGHVDMLHLQRGREGIKF